MRRRNFIKSIAVLPVIGFIPNLFANKVDPNFQYDNPQQGQTTRLKKGYPKTVKELTEWMEAALPVGESTDHQYSVTGEEYIEYQTRVIKSRSIEAEHCRFQWNTFTEQCRRLKGSGHKLYWRIIPEYHEITEVFSEQPPWKLVPGELSFVYSRYLISSKPEQRIANGS